MTPLERERWFADKGRRVAEVRMLDELRGLAVAEVAFDDGGTALYSLVDDDVRWPELLAAAEGRFRVDALGELPPPGAQQERLDLDQSHSSWRVGDAYVKCYRRLHEGVHPEVELAAALTRAGFERVPPALAALTWDGVALAIVQRFEPDARYGWDWAAERAVAGETAFAAEAAAVARALHEALAALGTRAATADDSERWAARAEEALAALDLETDAVSVVRAQLARLRHAGGTLQRVHGDLHVGQLLATPRGLLVVDFEGEPGRPLAERRLLDTPLRDLAALLRSLDHCARYAARHAGAEADEEWIVAARRAAADAYGPHDAQLLRALEWERAVYEFTYAAAYLPDWAYAPRGGLAALLREAR